MAKYYLFRRVVFSALLLSAVFCSCSERDRYIAITGFAQGGTYSVKVNLKGTSGPARAVGKELQAGIDSILLALDNSLSGYNRGSVLSRFNTGETVVPDDMFIDIYGRSYDFYESTGGAVDVASGPLFDIWGFGFTSDSLPDASKVAAVRDRCGMRLLKRDISSAVSHDGTLDPSDLLADGVSGISPELNYNAVAQGYTCDVIATYLYSKGVTDMLIDIGGEIYCDGKNPSGGNWAIGIDRPVDGSQVAGADIQAVLEVPDGPRGIVTSGNYRKFYVRDGRKYAHTIDPRTGYPVSHSLLSATVMTVADATAADALATYCMVIGLDEAIRFVESHDGIEAYLVYDDNGEMKSWASPGFRLR